MNRDGLNLVCRFVNNALIVLAIILLLAAIACFVGAAQGQPMPPPFPVPPAPFAAGPLVDCGDAGFSIQPFTNAPGKRWAIVTLRDGTTFGATAISNGGAFAGYRWNYPVKRVATKPVPPTITITVSGLQFSTNLVDWTDSDLRPSVTIPLPTNSVGFYRTKNNTLGIKVSKL